MAIKFMTWNVENLFPVNVGAGPKTQADYDRKLATLVRTIKKSDPDVLALQEVGDDSEHAQPRSLNDLLARVESYQAIVSRHPDQRGIRVAILTKNGLPVTAETEVIELDAKPPLIFSDLEGNRLTTMGRGAVHLRVDVQGRHVHVITAHLKSKLLTYPGNRFVPNDEEERVRVGALALSRRTAEVAALRLAVTKLRDQRHPVVLMGDLNDGAEAQTTELLHGPADNQPPGKAFGQKDAGDHQRLFNVTGFIPEERRYSRVFEGKRELIDHILVSVDFFPQVNSTQKRPPVSVDSLVDYATSDLEPVDEDPRARQGKAASDHSPVIAVLELP